MPAEEQTQKATPQLQFENNSGMNNITSMKNNPLMLIKQDNKRRNTPADLKRKLGSLSTDSVADYYLAKIDIKPRSTSKSADKSISLNFSKSYLAPSHPSRANSGERNKPASGKMKYAVNGHTQVPLLKIEKPANAQSSKPSHFHSADRDLHRTKSGNKSKSYLIDYLSQKHNSRKVESVGKLSRMKKDEKDMPKIDQAKNNI